MSTDQSSQAIVSVPQQRQIRTVEDNGPNACLLDTARFEHMQRIATLMGAAALMPDHLLGRKVGQDFHPFTKEQVMANCFLIVNRALRWGFDPFAVAEETYVVSGKLGFQGKLIAAVVNSRSNIKGRLKAEYNKSKGDAFEVTISGQFADEDDIRTITLNVGQGRTSNKMWTSDPEQKLWYSGVTKWARRHCPEVIAGVLTDDDIDRIRDREIEVFPSNSESRPRTAIGNMLSSGVAEKSVEEIESAEVKKTVVEDKTPPGESHMTGCSEWLKNQVGVALDQQDPETGKMLFSLPNGRMLMLSESDIAIPDGVDVVIVTDTDSVDQCKNILEHARKGK